VDAGGGEVVVVVVVEDPPLPLRIINAATAAMMIITTTMPAIKSVDEDPDAELELVVTTTVEPIEFDVVAVGVDDVEVVGATLEVAILEVVDTTALDELLVVGGRVVVEVLADVVDDEEPTKEAFASDCIFKEPQ